MRRRTSGGAVLFFVTLLAALVWKYPFRNTAVVWSDPHHPGQAMPPGQWGEPADLQPSVTIVGPPGGNGFGQVGAFAATSDGGVLVVDQKAGDGPTLYRFRSDGHLNGVLAQGGGGPGEISDGVQIAVDPSGDFAVTDRALARLSRFDSAGRFVNSFSLPTGAPVAGRVTILTDRSIGVSIPYAGANPRGQLRGSTAQTFVRFDTAGRQLNTLDQPDWSIDAEVVDSRYFPVTWYRLLRNGTGLVARNDRLTFSVFTPEMPATPSTYASGFLPPLRQDPELDELRDQLEFAKRMIHTKNVGLGAKESTIPARRLAFDGIEIDLLNRVWFVATIESYQGTAPPPPPNAPAAFADAPRITYFARVGAYAFTTDGTYLGEVRFPIGTTRVVFGTEQAWALIVDENGANRLTAFSLPH